ncbi:MAG: hypothetical protein WCT02_00570 [Candidatus Paceibacterota bacterium]
MTDEEKFLLVRTNKLVEENNVILRQMRRANRWGTAFRVFYWVIIIGVSIGALYFLQPYIDSVMKLYEQAQSSIQSLNSTVNQAQSAIGSVNSSIGNILKK